MSETQTETPATETRSQRRQREAAEAAASANGEQTDPPAPELTDEQKAEAAAIAAVESFTFASQLGEDGDSTFAKSTTPVRNRKPLQLAMDKVAAAAYGDWVAKGRPTLWQNMPVVTYFLDPDQVADYRSLIKKACEVVTPESFVKDGNTIEPSGVRVRFGNEFILSEKMAEKIGKPDQAGKTVLAWAAIDKRNVTKPDSES